MKKISVFLLFLLTVSMLLPLSVSADTGPKPSVRITFENMSDEDCYATLLSKRESTGPWSAWDGDEAHIWLDKDLSVWQAFQDYPDADGFYFLQRAFHISENGSLEWTYYPPSAFKILLWYPESGIYFVSDIYERYAFDSYFKVDLSDIAAGRSSSLVAVNSYDYSGEVLGLLCRIAITLAAELAIALQFIPRERKAVLTVVGINAVTQILLNVLLNVVNYQNGPLLYRMNYVLLELLVVLIEAVTYCIALPRICEKGIRKRTCVLFSVVANAGSFIVGMILAHDMPFAF